MSPITLSDRALKFWLILWLAKTALTKMAILAVYARPCGKDEFQKCMMELEGCQCVQRLGYREGWIAPRESYQLVLGEQVEIPRSGISSLSSSSYNQKGTPTDRELLLDHASEIPRSGISTSPVDNSIETVDKLEEYTRRVKAARSEGIGQTVCEELAALDWCTPEYIHAHCGNVAKKDIALAIWRMREGWSMPTKHNSKPRSKYLDYLSEEERKKIESAED